MSSLTANAKYHTTITKDRSMVVPNYAVPKLVDLFL